MAGWQSFDLTSYVTDLVTSVTITMNGTGSGADGFKLLDAEFLGTQVDNPSDTFHVSVPTKGAAGAAKQARERNIQECYVHVRVGEGRATEPTVVLDAFMM